MFTSLEFVGALCTILAFSSAIQILITGMLSFKFSHFLGVAHCHFATAAGVLSGLVAVPMLIQLKTSQISPYIDRKYGYTIWYRRLAIGVCAVLHFAAVIIAMYSLTAPRHRSEEFLERMEDYKSKHSAKALVDNVQWVLQCCGANSYTDWQNLPSEESGKADAGSELVKGVPFSCCSKTFLGPCYHYNIKVYGTDTVNTSGCASKISDAAHLILWIELSVYCLCFVVEIIILLLLHKTGNVEEGEIDNEFLIHKYLEQAKKRASSHLSYESSRTSKANESKRQVKFH